ncbi:hypothetical protein ONZ45_g9635 [Pleurotus djamor]|nr:hypothetical protein ONZ45_g9635 [Pleurotus djamor]
MSPTYSTTTKPHPPKSEAKARPTASPPPSNTKPRPTTAVKGRVSSEHNPKHPSSSASRVHAHPEANTGHHAKQSAPTDAEKSEEDIMKEQLAQIDQMMMMEKMFPTTDPWAQKVDTLDVELPYSVNPFRFSEYPNLRAMFDQFLANRQNALKSATSMWSLAGANAFPNVDLSRTGFFGKLFKWPFHVFRSRSTKADAWIAPWRLDALSSYIELNQASAANDVKLIKTYAIDAYQDNQLKLLKRRNPDFHYKWRFHGEVSPTRILSVRAMEGYLSPEEPRFGNRYMVHILVRFDTEQSLEIYDRQGNPLHAHKPEDNQGKKSRLNVPAEKRRVTEYLVLERRMWYNTPWAIREQIWERAGKARVAA